MVSEHSMQAHRSRMQDALVAKIRQTGVAMDDLNLLTNEDLSQDWEGREDSREGRGAVYDPMWKMVDLEPVRQVADPGSTW